MMMSGIKKTSSSKGAGYNYRRRFSDDQIKSLETTFETEARPELRLKQHLAGKLGLQPRQVAIWFQNKRARSKSKHLEREFSLLKSDFDRLASQYDSLKKENQTLLNQVERLRKMQAEGRNCDETEDYVITTSASSLMNGGGGDGDGGMIVKRQAADDDDVCIDDYLEDELKMGQIMSDEQLGSSEVGGVSSFDDSCSFLDNAVTGNNSISSSSQWWDF